MNIMQHIAASGDDENFDPPHACAPTLAPPGSQDKVEIMRMRVELGQPLWHPDDEGQLATYEQQSFATKQYRDIFTVSRQQGNANVGANKIKKRRNRYSARRR